MLGAKAANRRGKKNFIVEFLFFVQKFCGLKKNLVSYACSDGKKLCGSCFTYARIGAGRTKTDALESALSNYNETKPQQLFAYSF